MNYLEALALLEKHSQQHVLQYYDSLDADSRQKLLSEIEKIDFSVLDYACKAENKPLGRLEPADALSIAQINADSKELYAAGVEQLKAGKVAVVMLAGGQGTRLGFGGPKGTYNIGVNRPLSIFACQFNNLSAACRKIGKTVHVFVMTSSINDAQTRTFFEENGYFGYDKDKIHFFVQGEAPAISHDGKILMAEKCRPVFSPDGNGGWFAALIKAGYGKLLAENGIEWINVAGVDNVLQKLCDPLFVGALIKSGLACGAKVVKKAAPEEKVGVVCKEDGVATVVEYYDMPEEYKNMRKDGELVFCYGAILNYLFKVDKLKEMSLEKLPYHLADKKVPCIVDGQTVNPDSPNAYKFERLAVDIVKMMGSCLAFEVEREREFAPVKNATGVDSVQSARALLIKNGIRI